MVVKNNKQCIEWDKGPNCSLNCLFQSVLDVIFFLSHLLEHLLIMKIVVFLDIFLKDYDNIIQMGLCCFKIVYMQMLKHKHEISFVSQDKIKLC